MALPIIPVIAARLGWVAVGTAITIFSRSQLAKDATNTFKEGIDGLMEDYKRDLKKNQDMVKRIKAGKP